METQLSKTEKKFAREIIDKGLQLEFEHAMIEVDSIITAWKKSPSGKDNRATYHEILSFMKSHYRHLQRRYDGLRGSDYMDVVAALLAAKVISEEEIKDFRKETRDRILRIVKLRKEL